MYSSCQVKCGSTLQSSTLSMALPTSLEARDQMEINSGNFVYSLAGQGLRSQVQGRMSDPAFPNTANSSSCSLSHPDSGSSFLALLSRPASLLHFDFQDFSNPKSFNTSSKQFNEIGSVTVNPTGSHIPLTSSGLLSENGSYQNVRAGADLCSVVSSRPAASSNSGSNSAFQNGLPAANIGRQGSDPAKTVIHHTVIVNEKLNDFLPLRGEWRGTALANAVKLQSVKHQRPQKLPLEAEPAASNHSSNSTSGCPRVFCLDRSGDLLLSNTGLLGILCSCHCFHMSVSKFCEHSGLWNTNPGDAVQMESGETIAQWRKLYFQKFGIRIPEDQSGWDWPEGLSLTACLVKSGVPITNMPKNFDCSNLVSPSGGLVRSVASGKSLGNVSPRNFLADQNTIIDPLHDKQQINVQDANKNYLKGLVATSQSNSCGVGDNHGTNCSMSRCTTMLKFAGGPENVRQSINTDNLKKGSLATTHPTIQNHRTLVKNSDVSRGKDTWRCANVDKDALSSSIELKVGQPYQQSQSSGNPVLPVIGQPLYNTLVNSPKPFSQEDLIHNVARCRGEESRLFLPCVAGLSNSISRREQGQLSYAFNNTVDAAKSEKFHDNMAKTSVASLFKHYILPEGSLHSKASNNLLTVSEQVTPQTRHSESHAVKCDLPNIPWNGGNGFDRQYMVPELGFFKLADKGKGVGCLGGNSYAETASGYKMHKWMENPNSFAGVVPGNSHFPVLDDKNGYSCHLSDVLPDASNSGNFSNHLEKVPCLGSTGHVDYVFLRSMGSPTDSRQVCSSLAVPIGSPTSPSTSIPGLTPSMSDQENMHRSPHLLNDNLRLIALGQIFELSKQQQWSVLGKKLEQGKYCDSSNAQEQHSFVQPSVSEEQKLVPKINRKQDVSKINRKQDVSEVAMKSDHCGPTSMMVNDVDKFASATGLNRWCNFSTLAQGMPCQLSNNPLQNEPSLLRLGVCQNNNTHSNEHEHCCPSAFYLQYNCSCAAHTCRGGKCNLGVGNPPYALKEQTGSASCKTPMLISSQFAKDYFVPKENLVSFSQCETSKGQVPKNINCLTSQWKDVPSKVNRVCDVAGINLSDDALDGSGHELGQLEDGTANCSNGAGHAADPFKGQDMSNISSGCSTPYVTQASVEITNVDSSTVVGNNKYLNNLIVDEGSGINKCWSSDDAFESDRSADFYGSTCETNPRKEGSHEVVGNKSSRSLLDEVKLMDSLTWKKGRNQKDSGITVHGKINQSQESERGLRTDKRKRELKLKMLESSLCAAAAAVHDKDPDEIAYLSCSSKNMKMVSSGPDLSRTSGAYSIKINPKNRNSASSVTKALSRKRDLHRLYDAGDGEDVHGKETNYYEKSCKILGISGRKDSRNTRTADIYLQLQMRGSTQAAGQKTVKYDSMSSINASSSQLANLCYRKPKPVVCGKYGEITNGSMNGVAHASKPAKIVSLDKILKASRRCSLPKNCKPRVTGSRDWKRTNFSWRNAHFDKLSNLIKEKGNGRHDALLCEEINSQASLEERDNASISEDEQSAGEFSLQEKKQDKSGKGGIELDTNAQSKPKFKETRKRSLYELTLRGKNHIPKMVSQKKIFKSAPQMKLGKILRNSDKSQVHGSQKVDARRYVREQKHLSVTDIDSFCCVCGRSTNDEVNCLLACGRCSIRVHQACYGISKVPKGHWYCRPCRTSSKNIVCVLCGYGGGAMTRALRSRTIVKSLLQAWNFEIESVPMNAISSAEILQGGLSMVHSSRTIPKNCLYPVLRPVKPSTSNICDSEVKNHLDSLKNSLCHVNNLKVNNSITAGMLDSTIKQWVHMVCGLWTPGTRCPNVDTMSAFDVSSASRPRANVVCSLCSRTGGSCIQCRVANCSVHFHPWCAHQKGLLQSEVEGVDNENVGFYGRCVLHATCLANDSTRDVANMETGHEGEVKGSCAKTEGYKGCKRDGFWHNINGQSKGKSGCLVPQEQLNAWIHINGQKACPQGLLKQPMSEKEYDCRKEYARYKQSKGWKHLVVYKSGIHALGLYTSRFISRGEMVVEYVGEIVGLRVADKRENEYQSARKLQYKSACYFFRIDKEHIIDATQKGGIARFVNHSCLPNCVAKVISVRNEKKVVFFAERDIYPGEEITYDYHFNHEDEGKKIPCFCNSKNCKRYLN